MIEKFALFFKKEYNGRCFLLLLPSFRQVLKVRRLNDLYCCFSLYNFLYFNIWIRTKIMGLSSPFLV